MSYFFHKVLVIVADTLQESIWPVSGNIGGHVCHHSNEMGRELRRLNGHHASFIWSRSHCHQDWSVSTEQPTSAICYVYLISWNLSGSCSVILSALALMGDLPPVHWRCWLGGRKGIEPVKTEWWGAGVVICLERGADCLHMAQLMPLPLTVSCFNNYLSGTGSRG